MAKKNLTEIIVVLDRSGSMESMKSDAIGGFNAFIEKQKKQPGEARVTVALFDNEYELLENGTDINKVKPLTNVTYVPRGSTGLLDAIGRSINDVASRIKKAPRIDRPERVIMIVITDGHENASREFRHDTITEMLKKQREDHKWEVLFIGADESSVKDASHIGLGMTRGAGGQSVSSTVSLSGVACNLGCTYNYQNAGTILNSAYDSISMAVSNYRSKGTVGDWTKGEDLTVTTNSEQVVTTT